MMNKLLYVSIIDSCGSHNYIDQAFKMLKIQLQHLTPDKVNGFLTQHSNRPIAIIACEHHSELIDNILNDYSSVVVLVASTNLITDIRTTQHKFIQILIPFDIYQIKDALRKCESLLNYHQMYSDVAFDSLIGNSEPIKRVKEMVKQVAASDSNILILGQSGTGKNVIASCIHQLSHRKEKLFVPLNCGAIPGELIESELFGHEKGAFTGAISKRPGRFEIAHHGTLFLDEIGDMPLHMQVKLLRVLQERIIERVGSTVSIEVDVRLISATNKNLEEMIAQHQFREDLYYRLNVIPIYMPSLAERADDIPLLIDHHLNKISKRFTHHTEFSEAAITKMLKYEWPGNIRELANFIERMVVLNHDKVITVADVDKQLIKSIPKSSFSHVN